MVAIPADLKSPTFCCFHRGGRGRGFDGEPLDGGPDEAEGELLVLHVGRVERELHSHLHEETEDDVAARLRDSERAKCISVLAPNSFRPTREIVYCEIMLKKSWILIQSNTLSGISHICSRHPLQSLTLGLRI